MEDLGFFEEPLEPAALEVKLLELTEAAALIDAGIVGELSALDKREDDGIFEAGEDAADSFERKRVVREDIVGLHGGVGWQKRNKQRGRERMAIDLYEQAVQNRT